MIIFPALLKINRYNYVDESNIVKNAPEFDPRNYGYGKLSELVKAIDLFEIEKQQTHLILRNKLKK